MNSYVLQSGLFNNAPVVANHLNIPEPLRGDPTLLTFTEVTTLFHEFGHALHGMFSNVQYPSFAGTSVPRDFVEFPSQVNEMWSDWPEVLANYAVHHETGEPMPQDLLERVLAAQKFNQGYATTEYLAASIIDMALHTLTPDEVPSADELMQFEADILPMPVLILRRFRPATAIRTSLTSWAAIQPAITLISGAKCSMPIRLNGFAKTAACGVKMVSISATLFCRAAAAPKR